MVLTLICWWVTYDRYKVTHAKHMHGRPVPYKCILLNSFSLILCIKFEQLILVIYIILVLTSVDIYAADWCQVNAQIKGVS